MNADTYIVTGIGTDIGKTFIAAILVAGLEADYWKPVQAGLEPMTDSEWVRRTLELPADRIHPEAFVLTAAESPHSAARKQGLTIELDDIFLPSTGRPLIIEGAGGIMTPLNDDEELFIDLFRGWELPVVLVVDVYLGCINHTLLTLEALSVRNMPIKGIVFNRREDPEVESFIQNYADVPVLGHIPYLPNANAATLADAFKTHLRW